MNTNTPYGKPLRLSDPKIEEPWSELKNLKQTGSVQSYQEAFEALLNRVDLPELVGVSMFIGGLKPEVGTPMRMFQATTLSESYGLAKMQEATNTILKSSTHNFLDIHTAKKLGCRLAKTTPMQVSVANGQRMMSTSVWNIHHNQKEPIESMGQGIDGFRGEQASQESLLISAVMSGSPSLICGSRIRQSKVENEREEWRFARQLSGLTKVRTDEFIVMPMVNLCGWFFDDIFDLGYKNLEEHCDHLAQVLQVMKDNILYAKRSKCYFVVPRVEYLGHIISAQGVSTDPSKIEAMQKWPIPSTLKQLRGFLGLTGYYRRFIKDYASISQPLVALTKKDAFKWNPSAELAYHKLKEAMVKAPVLALPNFEQEFVVETDASGKGIGAVLCQNGHPIAYWSKTLSAKHQALSTYEKEFLAVVAALDKWKGYLLDRHFKIRTDHFSLKYLLNQKLTTPFQFKWLPKLLGYDYEIVYKKGSENVVADALSRIDSSGELLQISISSVSSRFGTLR
ncbi:putative mitochondrial protein [Tanacetum coccineum]